jgi:rhodanese-related sulfurtransferase
MKFLQATLLLALMVSAISMVSAQTTKPATKACCATGSTTDISGKKCDPKACTPQTGSAKACCSTASGFASMSTTSFNPKEFKKHFKKDQNKVLIDVRTPDEFAEGHLKNAQNIDYLNDDFEKNIQHLDKSKNYYLYCRSGKRTAEAAAVMQKLGFENIFVMEGGLLAWEALKLPITM